MSDQSNLIEVITYGGIQDGVPIMVEKVICSAEIEYLCCDPVFKNSSQKRLKSNNQLVCLATLKVLKEKGFENRTAYVVCPQHQKD